VPQRGKIEGYFRNGCVATTRWQPVACNLPSELRHVMRLFAHLAASLAGCLTVFLLTPGSLGALETVMINMDGRPQTITGQIVAEDSVGSMLLETDDGSMWPIDASSIRSRTSDSQKLERLNKDQLAAKLLEEMGPGFQVHHSKNYVVVHNTTRVYARWCSSLLERLHSGFLSYWKRRGAEVEAIDSPLPVLVFGDKASYANYAKNELGNAVNTAIGYYSMQSNRIVMYDLTGIQTLRRENTRRGNLQDIGAILNQPEAEPLVSTIVHEATHQIAFNCGLQTRFAANPVWVAEGLAMFCETPDLNSRSGWSGFGKVNYQRWDRFRQNSEAGRLGTLRSLVVSDDRLRDPREAVNAYAEAWAWTYYFITWHSDAYVAYLKHLAEKPVLVQDDKKTRLADFTKFFGDDFDGLDQDFYRRMSRLK